MSRAKLERVTVAEKRCARCGEVKPAAEFGPSKQTVPGLAAYCFPCRRATSAGYYRRWTPEQRAANRERILRSKYKITSEQIRLMYELQEGRCAICGRPGARPAAEENTYEMRGGILHLDHDHETGKVRGLLCGRCNRGLGNLGDDVSVLIKAAAYVMDHKED